MKMLADMGMNKGGAMLALLVCMAGMAIGDSRYLGVADGNWTNATSWTGGVVPGAADRGIVNNGGTARINGPAACDWAVAAENASGTIVLSEGADLVASNYFFVGQAAGSAGLVVQNGGAVTTQRLRLGDNAATASGRYELNGGSISAGEDVFIGQNGTGVVVQAAGDIAMQAVNKVFYLGLKAGSFGRYEIAGGTFSGRLNIGSAGTGYLKQSGGTVNVNTGFSCGGGSGTGTYELVGGSLVVVSGVNVSLGYDNTGTGTFLLGNATASGSIVQDGGLSGLYLGSSKGGTGMLKGWGEVGLKSRIRLYTNGCVVADGYGVDRDLDLTQMDSTVNLYGDGHNNGWYAQNRGRLLLPARSIGPGYLVWGDRTDAPGPSTNIVNCVHMQYGGTAATTWSGALLAPDRSDVLPAGPKLIGVWTFELGNPAVMTGAALTFRYDSARAAALGIPEADLRVMRSNGTRWIDITDSIDTTRHLVKTTPQSSLGMFAVGVLRNSTLITVR